MLATGGVTGTRFYPLPGGGEAIRTGSGTQYGYEMTDQHGTATVALDNTAQVATWRQSTPYGAPRGTTPNAWPDQHGFLNKPTDSATGLVDVGARAYDPSSGRFISIDPVLDPTNPQSMTGYTYADDNPTTSSDPTGLMMRPDPGGGGTDCQSEAECDSKGYQNVTDSQKTTARNRTDLKHWINDHSPKGDNLLQIGGLLLLGTRAGNFWDTPVNSGPGPITHVCFGADGCAAAYRYLNEHPDDLPGAQLISATYCLENMTKCEHDSTWTSFAQAVAGAALGAIGGLGGEIAADASAEEALCSGNSFTADTPVLMADGTSKPIDQVNVGDKITNAQPDSLTTETDTVTAVHVTYTDHDYDQLTIATPTGPKTITSTAEHLYWDTTTHTWTRADNLNPGDQLDTPGNGHVTVLATRHYTALQTTYNLTINYTHTYYVLAGPTPVLVHNCGGARFAIGSDGVATDLQPLGRGSTGRTTPSNLNEQLAMQQAMSDPAAGRQLRVTMTDPRWPAQDQCHLACVDHAARGSMVLRLASRIVAGPSWRTPMSVDRFTR